MTATLCHKPRVNCQKTGIWAEVRNKQGRQEERSTINKERSRVIKSVAKGSGTGKSV